MFGFTKIYVDDHGNPAEQDTCWIADAFVIFGFCVWIGKIRHESELDK